MPAVMPQKPLDLISVQQASLIELPNLLKFLGGSGNRLDFLTGDEEKDCLRALKELCRPKLNIHPTQSSPCPNFDKITLAAIQNHAQLLKDLLEKEENQKRYNREKLAPAIVFLAAMVDLIELIRNPEKAQITAEYLQENSELQLFQKDDEGNYQVTKVPAQEQQAIQQNLQHRNQQSFRVWTSSISGNDTLVATENEPACIEAMANHLIKKCQSDPSKTIFIKEGKPSEKELFLKLCARGGAVVKSCGGTGGWPNARLKALHETLAYLKEEKKMDISDWTSVLRYFIKNPKPIKQTGIKESLLQAISPINLLQTYLSCFQSNDEAIMSFLHLANTQMQNSEPGQQEAMKAFHALDRGRSANSLNQYAVLKKLIKLDPEGNNTDIALKRHHLYASGMLEQKEFTAYLDKIFDQACEIRGEILENKEINKEQLAVTLSKDEVIESKILIEALRKNPDFLIAFIQKYKQRGKLLPLVMNNATVEDLIKFVENFLNSDAVNESEKGKLLLAFLKSLKHIDNDKLISFLESLKPSLRKKIMPLMFSGKISFSKSQIGKLKAHEFSLAKKALLGMAKDITAHKNEFSQLFQDIGNNKATTKLLLGYESDKISLATIMRDFDAEEISAIYEAIFKHQNENPELQKLLEHNFFQVLIHLKDDCKAFLDFWKKLDLDARRHCGQYLQSPGTSALYETARAFEICEAKTAFLDSIKSPEIQKSLERFYLKKPDEYLDKTSFKQITPNDIVQECNLDDIYLIHSKVAHANDESQKALYQNFFSSLNNHPKVKFVDLWEKLSISQRRAAETYLSNEQKAGIKSFEISAIKREITSSPQTLKDFLNNKKNSYLPGAGLKTTSLSDVITIMTNEELKDISKTLFSPETSSTMGDKPSDGSIQLDNFLTSLKDLNKLVDFLQGLEITHFKVFWDNLSGVQRKDILEHLTSDQIRSSFVEDFLKGLLEKNINLLVGRNNNEKVQGNGTTEQNENEKVQENRTTGQADTDLIKFDESNTASPSANQPSRNSSTSTNLLEDNGSAELASPVPLTPDKLDIKDLGPMSKSAAGNFPKADPKADMGFITAFFELMRLHSPSFENILRSIMNKLEPREIALLFEKIKPVIEKQEKGQKKESIFRNFFGSIPDDKFLEVVSNINPYLGLDPYVELEQYYTETQKNLMSPNPNCCT